MAIKTGRYGQVRWDPTGTPGSPAALAVILSLNSWKLSLKTDYEDVSCFQDPNKVYVPGLRDISGSLGGFWNADGVAIFDATEATTPGLLELSPNTNEPTFNFSGLAYLDADIDCSIAVPKVSSSFRAGGPWTIAP
jgi:hypothetical protein